MKSWRGWRRTDPEGYVCRIGELWTRIFLRRGWVIVLAGQVWLGHPITWRRYLRSTHWRAHEHHHIWQERALFRSTLAYVVAFVWQYIRFFGHDGSPLEREADLAADRHMEILAKLERSRDA